MINLPLGMNSLRELITWIYYLSDEKMGRHKIYLRGLKNILFKKVVLIEIDCLSVFAIYCYCNTLSSIEIYMCLYIRRKSSSLTLRFRIQWEWRRRGKRNTTFYRRLDPFFNFSQSVNLRNSFFRTRKKNSDTK